MAASLSGQEMQGSTEKGESSDIIRQIGVILATVATIGVNTLAVTLPLNGKTTGDLSDQYPLPVTPAGYVFSIWSIIYTGLIAYAIYQALPSQRTNPRLRAIGAPFILSCLVNMGWIFAWHYEILPASLALMLVILGSLITIYARLYPGYSQASTAERWTTHIPFRIYLGWITVATIANFSVQLYALGWRGEPLNPALWTVVLIGVAAGIGLFFGGKLRDAAYTLVLTWAFAGIGVANLGQEALVVPVAFGASAIMGIVAILAIFRK